MINNNRSKIAHNSTEINLWTLGKLLGLSQVIKKFVQKRIQYKERVNKYNGHCIDYLQSSLDLDTQCVQHCIFNNQGVVYFDQLSGAVRMRKLVKILISFFLISDRNSLRYV